MSHRIASTSASLVASISLALTGAFLCLRGSHAGAGPLAPGPGPSVIGQWASVWCDSGNINPTVFDFPQVIHAALLHTGKVLMFGHGQGGVYTTTGYGLFTPGPAGDTNPCPGSLWTQVESPPASIRACNPEKMTPFCGGHVLDQDGNVIVLSGQEDDTCNPGQQPEIHSAPTSRRALRFNVATSEWDTTLADMNSRRWYPFVSTHSTGELIAWNGLAANDTCPEYQPPSPTCSNPDDEARYKPEWLRANGSGAWTQLSDAGSRCYGDGTGGVAPYAPAIRHPVSSKYILASTHYINRSQNPCNPPTLPGTAPADLRHDTYEVAYQVIPGATTCTSYANLNNPNSFVGNHADGPHVILPMKAPFDVSNGSWMWIGGYDGAYYEGCDNSPTNQVDRFNASDLTWTTDEPMFYKRMWANAVLLPNETVFVHGGGDVCWPRCNHLTTNHGCPPPSCPPGYDVFGCECAQLTPELYTPTNQPGFKWNKMAKSLRPRNYHSVALLIPDGRVVVAGGEYQTFRADSCSPGCLPTERSPKTLEFYKPPYFFTTGTRPTICDPVPAAVNFGGQLVFKVSESIATSGKVIFMRPSAVTHAVNMTQQIVELPFTEAPSTGCGATTYEITAQVPSQSANLMPPGWEMLWVIDNQGLPAVQAKWVQVKP